MNDVLTPDAFARLAEGLPLSPLEKLPQAWTFWAETIVGRHPLGPVQPTSFNCIRRLSGFGTGDCILPVDSHALPPERLTRLWSWVLWAFYGGEPVWCGVPNGISDDGEGIVSLTMTELTGYLQRRQFDVPGGQRYTLVEQTQIAADLAAPVADVGVVVTTDPGGGFPRTREYEYLEGENRATLLTNLAEVISGPQFRAAYGWDSGRTRPVCTLQIGYPRVGGESGFGVAVPGEAIDYGASWDSDALRTRTFAVGDLRENAPEGTPKPVVIEDRPQPDLPRLDAADDWPQVYLVSTLTERANTAATQNAAAALELSVTVPDSMVPAAAYAPGDDVMVRIVSPFLAGGIDAAGTLTEVSFNAREDRASWTVALALPPPRARESLARRLDRLDLTLAGVFRRNLAPQP